MSREIQNYFTVAGAVAVLFFGIVGLLWAANSSTITSQVFNNSTIAFCSVLALIFAALIIAMWRFSPGHDYWGERHEISAAITDGTRFIPGSPLAMLINLSVFTVINSIFLTSPPAKG